ncbi:MAG: 50S ribosomal protein L9 [Gammaproteobacteria bacterium]|jgi:large subunit ribosomal protein L9
MNIILLEKVQNLGKLGDRISVKNGYARNYLLPKGKAVLATPQNVAIFEERRAALEKAEAEILAKAQARSEAINGKSITISVKAGEEGKLFGSVGTSDIAEAAKQAGMDVGRQEVRLPGGAFRNTGSYEVEIHLHPDVDAQLTVNIVAEE